MWGYTYRREFLDVGSMIMHGVTVTATCSSCHPARTAEVDLKRLRDDKGPYFSLVDRFGRCSACGSHARYYATLYGQPDRHFPLFTGPTARPIQRCGWCGSQQGHRPPDWWAILGRPEKRGKPKDCPDGPLPNRAS
jgi:hypothetical protein